MTFTKKFKLSSGLGVMSSRCARCARSKARRVDWFTDRAPEKQKGDPRRQEGPPYRISTPNSRRLSLPNSQRHLVKTFGELVGCQILEAGVVSVSRPMPSGRDAR